MTTRSLSYTFDAGGPPPGLPSASEILGRSSGENFTVASVILPRPARRHLMAFYGYARLVDQIGDAYEGDRMAALQWLEAETRAALEDPAGRHPLVAAAAGSVRSLGADPGPLFDLIEANRLDQTVHSYGTFAELRSYCRLSADPVGRLVLAAFGRADPARVELSDAICTGLQLVEHWQDVQEDARAGRVYLPDEDLRRFGVDRAELAGGGPPSPALRALMAFEVARARDWLDRGRPLVSLLAGRPRVAVAGFWAGGHAALDAIADRHFDVLRPAGRPRPDRVARRMLLSLRPGPAGRR
ncbi:MAG TPA: squalene synthase HpnC [Acidimicrobiales bacterium]|nr:squalene synthase HpnC [Acidimicrobiales bacterium]